MMSDELRWAQQVAIVLVHGACHGSWCWEEVEQPLISRGWAVSAVDLPLTSLRDDAAVVSTEVGNVKRRGSAVLLVGHSYGGIVISEAGHEADALVYCAGSVPEPGESSADAFPRISTPELTDSLETSEDGTVVSIRPDRAAAAFYNRCTEGHVARAVARLRPMRVQPLNELVRRPAWLEVPASYIVCTDDYAMHPDYQRERAQRLGEYIVLDTDHSPFYSAPDQFIERIDALARRLRDNSVSTSVLVAAARNHIRLMLSAHGQAL
jgi:pimeloyl-ACP methyl ester carboxylesterase